MKKYAISREFFPWNLFAPPISEKFLAMSVPHMKPPKFLWRDKELDVTTHEITGNDGTRITCFVLSPGNLPRKAPCLMYFHGGGFVLEAAGYHYANAIRYAKEVGCKVVFPLYRLAPQQHFPTFFEDCYASFGWDCDHAETLGIDTRHMGVGGDSAGFVGGKLIAFGSLDRTGNGRMDRDAQALIVTDLLTHQHPVTLFDQGQTGRADMLAHGDHQQVRLRKILDFLFFRIPFVFLRMYTSENRKRHILITSLKVSRFDFFTCLSYRIFGGLSTKFRLFAQIICKKYHVIDTNRRDYVTIFRICHLQTGDCVVYCQQRM